MPWVTTEIKKIIHYDNRDLLKQRAVKTRSLGHRQNYIHTKRTKKLVTGSMNNTFGSKVMQISARRPNTNVYQNGKFH